MKGIFGLAQQAIDAGRAAVMAVVVESKGSTPRKAGARMLIYADGDIEGSIGGGRMEKLVIEAAMPLFESGGCQLLRFDLDYESSHGAAACGGATLVFIERIGSPARLLIFGAGHVGRALARFACEMEFQVIVYDDRVEYADSKYFPDSVQVIHGAMEEGIASLKPAGRDCVAIMTYDYRHDQKLLEAAMQTPARYIGMIGSRSKSKVIRQNLLAAGVSQESLERIHAPIGLDIGAHTPAEIAVSVLAEIIQHTQAQPPEDSDG